MFKIGEFSRFTRVSVKTLRHYDEIGLLRPRVVDRFTNYRYYSADQVPRLNQILALRELGFSLEQIGRLLDAALSPEQLRGMFLGKRGEIVARMHEEEQQLGRVDTYLAQLSGEQTARYDVVVRQVAPGLVASVRAWIATDRVEDNDTPEGGGQSDNEKQGTEEDPNSVQEQVQGNAQDTGQDEVAMIFDEVEQYVARFKARASLPPLLIYNDSEFRADGQALEFVIPLTNAIPATERILVYEMPAWDTMACLIHRGGYEQMGQTLGALLQWIEMNNFAIAGPMREVFLRFGADQEGYEVPESYLTEQVDELVTELQVPIVRRKA